MAEQTLSGRDLLAPKPLVSHAPSTGMILLVLAALGSALLGLSLLSQATMGVGFLALACFCGILARIVQASAQHRALMNKS